MITYKQLSLLIFPPEDGLLVNTSRVKRRWLSEALIIFHTALLGVLNLRVCDPSCHIAGGDKCPCVHPSLETLPPDTRTQTLTYADLRHPSPANTCLLLLIMTQHFEPEFLILAAGVLLEMICSRKVVCFCAEGGEASHAASSLSLYFFDPTYTLCFHLILCQLHLHSNYLFLLCVFFFLSLLRSNLY